MTASRFAALALAALATLGAASGCGRSDFMVLEPLDSAGEGGTSAGGTSTGGTGVAGTGGTPGGTGGTTGGTGGTTAGTGTGGTNGCGGGLSPCGGVCVDLSRDPGNCGQCFSVCASDAVCSNGLCQPVCEGATNCFGRCTDITSDPGNCGRCGIVCGSGASCVMGTCSTPGCRPPLVQCPGGRCVNLSNDTSACGNCDTQCLRVGEICSTGVCECPGRESVCGNRCVDLQTSRANCGRCGVVCANDQICADGVCRSNCPPEFSDCDGDCRNLQTDPDHCGRCDNSCPRAQVCNAGRCDTSCGNLTSCNGLCRDLEHDPGHCGTCDTACDPGEICADGTCALVCGPGITNCNGTCRDLRVDPANCGTCGHACSARQLCRAGTCIDVTSTLYSAGPSPAAFIHACGQPGSSLLMPDVDDSVTPLMLPWAFPFYGVPTQSAWVSSNGVMGFGSPSPAYVNECSFGTVPRAIFAFWDDLGTRPSGVCVATVGSPPNRTFVATWSAAYILAVGLASDLTFSVQLSESTGTIDVIYSRMAGGGTLSSGSSATIGLASDNQYTLDCCNQSCVMSGTGRRYTPVIR